MGPLPTDTPTPASAWEDDLVQLYRDRYVALVRLAYLVSGDAGRAEEVVQEAFVKAHRSWATVREPLPYLRTAVVNGCRSLGRRRRLEQVHRPDPPEPAAQQPDELWDALATLTERQRAAIVLRYYADLSHADVAALLGCPEATVRTAVHRGLARLRREIDR